MMATTLQVKKIHKQCNPRALMLASAARQSRKPTRNDRSSCPKLNAGHVTPTPPWLQKNKHNTRTRTHYQSRTLRPREGNCVATGAATN